jgi:hypothetical protein
MVRKRSTKYIETEARIAQALDAIKKNEVKTVNAASVQFSVSHKTLGRRLKGVPSYAGGHESSQLLSQAEEEALLLWCKRLTAGGYPARHQVIREMAWEILTRRVASINTDGMQIATPPPIGQDWMKRFIKRHSELQTICSARIDLNRWKDTTPEAINKWFDEYQETHRIYNFEKHNIYNMDETGFAIGTSQCSRVVIDTTLRTRYKLEPGHQEWVSAVECICADGSFLPPLIIMKAEHISGN